MVVVVTIKHLKGCSSLGIKVTMKRSSRQNLAIREFVLKHVEEHPKSVVSLATKEFGVTRKTVGQYMKRLIAEGILTAEGKTNARHYTLRKIVDEVFFLHVTAHLEEDVIWRQNILPHMKIKPNVVGI